jgi:hypothetical protein
MAGASAISMPRLTYFKEDGWHRLIPSEYGRDLSSLAEAKEELDIINRLDGSTDDSVQAQNKGLLGIKLHELVFGFLNAEIVNDAFCYPGKDGNRFNDNTRGAWYAADFQETSVAEVAFHKAHRLAEIILPGSPHNRPERDVHLYDDWLANFDTDVHWLEPRTEYEESLKSEPIPGCYAASQALANVLLNGRSNGILYPSVRREGFRCIACFRPALVHAPRRESRIEITLESTPTGYQLLPVREVEIK